jgi:hypothetical protein
LLVNSFPLRARRVCQSPKSDKIVTGHLGPGA